MALQQQGGGQQPHGPLGEVGSGVLANQMDQPLSSTGALTTRPHDQGNMNGLQGLIDALSRQSGGQDQMGPNRPRFPQQGSDFNFSGDSPWGPQPLLNANPNIPPILRDAIMRRLSQHPQRMVS